jgi:hypothetical protein
MIKNRIIIKKLNYKDDNQVKMLIQLENKQNNIKPHYHLVRFDSKNPCLENLEHVPGVSTHSNGYFCHALETTIDDFQKIPIDLAQPKVLIINNYTSLISSYNLQEQKSIKAKIENLISVGASLNISIWIVAHSFNRISLNLEQSTINMFHQ